MKKSFLVACLLMAVLGVSMVSAMWPFTGKVVADGEFLDNSDTCFDSDGGVFSGVVGKVMYKNWLGRDIEVEDKCTLNGRSVYEYYCSNGNKRRRLVACEDGCENGKCNLVVQGEKSDVAGDTEGNGRVNDADRIRVQNWFGESCSSGNGYCNGADLNRDGMVGQADLDIVLGSLDGSSPTQAELDTALGDKPSASSSGGSSGAGSTGSSSGSVFEEGVLEIFGDAKVIYSSSATKDCETICSEDGRGCFFGQVLTGLVYWESEEGQDVRRINSLSFIIDCETNPENNEVISGLNEEYSDIDTACLCSEKL